MARYEASVITTLVTATANAPLAALRGVTRPCFIREIHMFGLTAPTTSGALGLARSTALGTGALTSVTGQPIEAVQDATTGAPAGTGILVTNWATAAPTVAAAYLRRWAQPASIGNGILWTWNNGGGLYVPGNAQATSELVLCNLVATAPGTVELTVVWDE